MNANPKGTKPSELALPLALDNMGYIVDAHGRDVSYDKAALADLLALANRCAEVEAHAQALADALRTATQLATTIMRSQGYTEGDNGAWLGPWLHQIQDEADAALAAWEEWEGGGHA